jgi:transcriptional regulator of PTS gene
MMDYSEKWKHYCNITPISADLFKTNDIRVKDVEKAKIFDIIFNEYAKSRKAILEKFHFRPTVLTNAVRELIEDGFVTEEKKSSNRSGRPEIGLVAVPDRLVAICFHAESRNLKAALVNLKGEILQEIGKELSVDSDGDDFLELCKEQIKYLINLMPCNATLAGIGLSLPGSVDTNAKTLLSTYRWPKVKHLELRNIESEFGYEINVRKDLDSILEHYILAYPELAKGNTLLFHWGFGVGFAFAQNGRNINKESGRFGEVGHTRLDAGNKKPCICGSAGCIETDTAIWAILPNLKQFDASLVDDEEIITEFCESHPEIETVVEIREALRTISLTLMNMYRIFFPSHILLLGPFFAIPSIVQSLEEQMIIEISSKDTQMLDFRIIKDGYRGCIYTNARYVFANKLRKMLRAKF